MGKLMRVSRPVELDSRNNALNLFRLLLAGLVLVDHTYFLSGHGDGPLVGGRDMGTWAVYGFFAISGYLITGSRVANPWGRFLLKRVARIFPGFLACNVVVAFVLGPIAWLADGRSLSAYLTGSHGPIEYVVANAPLKIAFYDIAGGPFDVPIAGVWNGSLWSLYFEFLCYLAIGFLASLAIMRGAAPMAAVYLVALGAWAAADRFAGSILGGYQVRTLTELVPWFFGGAAVFWLTRKRVLDPRLAAAAAVGTVLLVALSDRWGPQAAAPLVVYDLIWLATVIPSPRLVQTHDVSYGVYIYAFPVQQVLATFGVVSAGIAAFAAAAAIGTVSLATASWLMVERPAMALLQRVRYPPWMPRRARPGS
ncbi:peptidoglycan/LPS O-acetylase OafA/YrhL [Phycicoccus badiiscoriae]|uniref:Peptidoglycan/LPS O-acetylase OafA/YrhL n=1 Tax=Pedococcus badiiscoriae TaxID=642776 RepID=A0A852WIG8_9MICO|nr:acyltransferase [Pedococcus badiiscoriae]NYG07381.1 peptidoglycan/LPS O-acetylase OafA/YrhL [Pedococcus badiiscoriae]